MSPKFIACWQRLICPVFTIDVLNPSRRMGRFRHVTFKLVVVRLKVTFRLNVTCSVCVQISAFSKKVVSAFSVNDHVAVQTSLSDLSKLCKQGGDQILLVNIRISKYLFDLPKFCWDYGSFPNWPACSLFIYYVHC